jgi:hypothetical protein
VLRAINAATQAESSSGPFRVHRLSPWVPIGWSAIVSSERLGEVVNWEIDTLQPSFGLLHGISYVLSDESETGRADYRQFFEPVSRVMSGQNAAVLGLKDGQQVLYHPRRAFDLWGARYFILPSYPADWKSGNRAYAAFVDQTEMIYPDPASMEGPGHRKDRESWLQNKDIQVRRNKAAFPRAWIVHAGRLIRPRSTSNSRGREALSSRLGFDPDPSRADSSMPAPDLRSLAYVETDDPDEVMPYLPGNDADQAESVTVRYESPTRAVLDVRLSRPGLVVLADVFDHGWRLAVDGRPARILRANLLMRAAAVDSGVHALVYTYEPASVRIGAWISLIGVSALVALAAWSWVQPCAENVA